jgi:hypothetical protein
MAFPALVPPGFTLAIIIDAIFAVNGTVDPTLRREVWERVYSMTRVDITVDENTITVYFGNQQWCVDLWHCQDDGDCQLSEPLCLQLEFLNRPS